MKNVPALRAGRFSAVIFAFLILTTACGPAAVEVPVLEVERQSTEFSVIADGEVIASEALPISLPSDIRMEFNVVWLAPEFSEVKKGEVIARFDDVQVRLDREASALNVAKSEFRLAGTERTGKLEATRIDHESDRVEGERDISEAFEGADEQLFSRNELIDILADIDFLDAESSFLDWQFETLDQRTQAEQNLILAERQGELSKLEKQESALSLMELKSPADGTFVYARTGWGGKMRKGRTVHAGMPIGMLPVRGMVRLRLFVPESDAVGLSPGQLVRFRLDSVADQEFDARVATVSPVASPRDRRDPQKFFRVEADIDEVDPRMMRVGSRLRAEIVTGTIERGIVVPSQVVFGENQAAYVYRVNGSDPERLDVEVGQRSPDLVEIISGLEPGDRISLAAPAGES
ncbi:MAG: HlyD family efflux transporter periplasmic adaptor subunit [Xanthomonadales bacterium]|nr:HlyD family efflux transporter periplasmic adaptor subunit [Xanthomonadales bacterium]